MLNFSCGLLVTRSDNEWGLSQLTRITQRKWKKGNEMKFDQLLLPVLLLSVFAIRAGWWKKKKKKREKLWWKLITMLILASERVCLYIKAFADNTRSTYQRRDASFIKFSFSKPFSLAMKAERNRSDKWRKRAWTTKGWLDAAPSESREFNIVKRWCQLKPSKMFRCSHPLRPKPRRKVF